MPNVAYTFFLVASEHVADLLFYFKFFSGHMLDGVGCIQGIST